MLNREQIFLRKWLLQVYFEMKKIAKTSFRFLADHHVNLLKLHGEMSNMASPYDRRMKVVVNYGFGGKTYLLFRFAR